MEAKELTSDEFNEQQLMMLRLLKKPMPDNDFIQIRRLVVKLLSKQIDEEMGDCEVENNITTATYKAWSKMHFRASGKS